MRRAATAWWIAATLVGAGAPEAIAAAPDWERCTRPDLKAMQCATFPVPMDRSDPQRGIFELAMVRHRATGPRARRIGSLFFNPGGPGGSGRDFISTMVEKLPTAVTRRYDVVSWDPRGVGDTRPALEGCDGPWPDRPATGPVDWRAVVERHAATVTQLNRACAQRNRPHIDHMGTVDVVEDLDAMRDAVGDRRLNYVGMSYGTRIGYVYAMRHPDRVGRFVLDGNVDPIGSIRGLSVEGPQGIDEALGYYFQTSPRARARFETALRLLGRQTIDLGAGSVYTRWNFLDLTLQTMGSEDGYAGVDALSRAVRAASRGDARAKSVLRRARRGQGPNTDSSWVFSVVNCHDYADRPSLAEMQDIVLDAAARGPVYGPSLATSYVTGCAGLAPARTPVPLATPTATDARILVASATRDARTPYAWSVRMARAFPNSRMLTYPGGQHVVTVRPSRCSARVIRAYLIKHRLPARDVACPQPTR